VFKSKISVVALLAAGFSLAVAVPGAAAAPARHDFVFPASAACTFKLGVDFDGAGTNQVRVTQNRNGLPRIISAGTGFALTFTNDVTGEQASFTSNGAVAVDQAMGDGTTLSTLTGHNAVFMSPADHPAGPSATLYIGQVVISKAVPIKNADSVFTVLRSTGTAVDICAAVS